MSKSSQQKGRRGEIELCNVLRECGISAEPGQAVGFGCTPDVVGISGIHAEVKRVEKLNILTAMQQAIRDSEKFGDGMPAVFHRRNRAPWMVSMLLNDWIELYKIWKGE